MPIVSKNDPDTVEPLIASTPLSFRSVKPVLAVRESDVNACADAVNSSISGAE